MYNSFKQLVSLLELLRFFANKYVDLLTEINNAEHCAFADEAEGVQIDCSGHLKLLNITKRLCEELDLSVSAISADRLIKKLSRGKPCTPADLAHMRSTITDELSSNIYLAVPTDKARLFRGPIDGWEPIVERFPECLEDVEEMNRCFALSRYTASVFHSLMVAEHGLICLGDALGVTDPKRGWDATCNRLALIVKAGRGNNSTAMTFSFLEQINERTQAMKHAWRNKVYHADGKLTIFKSGFSESVAQEIIMATRAFMSVLGEGIIV